MKKILLIFLILFHFKGFAQIQNSKWVFAKPLPGNESVSFLSNKEFADKDILQVYNFLKQKILEITLPAANSQIKIDVSAIDEGIYLVRHLSRSAIVSESKLVIIR